MPAMIKLKCKKSTLEVVFSCLWVLSMTKTLPLTPAKDLFHAQPIASLLLAGLSCSHTPYQLPFHAHQRV